MSASTTQSTTSSRPRKKSTMMPLTLVDLPPAYPCRRRGRHQTRQKVIVGHWSVARFLDLVSRFWTRRLLRLNSKKCQHKYSIVVSLHDTIRHCTYSLPVITFSWGPPATSLVDSQHQESRPPSSTTLAPANRPRRDPEHSQFPSTYNESGAPSRGCGYFLILCFVKRMCFKVQTGLKEFTQKWLVYKSNITYLKPQATEVNNILGLSSPSRSRRAGQSHGEEMQKFAKSGVTWLWPATRPKLSRFFHKFQDLQVPI